MHSEPLAKRLSSQEYGRVYISLLSQKRKLDTAIWVSFFHAVLATLRPILEREKLATHPDVGVLRLPSVVCVKITVVLKAAHLNTVENIVYNS